MGAGRFLVGMELARARARAVGDPAGREAALVRAGDAYERARRPGWEALGEAAPRGAGEAIWRVLGWLLAGLLAAAPGLRRGVEDRLLRDLADGPSRERSEAPGSR